ncbi:hypothetical protein NCU16913 [Neurospora crassa OR74A]|uniref:C2H2-type domain-containing protein n=1 Tax=Neurospora crassa (strain ATCC 24698 / 74-OR23-1A / CBS 708.71 / DSM 1257 / FGSC 987) TaxID=367110 RepID=V5IME9_NEUCR|nr:hypothetical protein NCU16913 [Neurospora crassa OR74A]ESA42344.1 hypothetical protein NCU16913 [Neurospora crassa OR74A]|eukprot:XP_011394797.1 hypothetical protein NCU16913 [Neurospora crassa OR74A]
MPPAGADMNRKRPSEGEPEDAARPHKRRSHGAPAVSSTPASSGECDPPALTSLADGSRRYDEFKGDIGDGVYRALTGGGAYFPTNYKLFLKHPAPWLCPLVDCRKSFNQCSNLGRHFSKAHRGWKLYDEEERGFFHFQGIRTKPDEDGKLRPIVVGRGFRAPKRQDDRQTPDTSAADTATAPLASTTARAINSSTSAPITLAQASRLSSRKVIDISSNDEGVKPTVNDTSVRNTGPHASAKREQARGENKSTGTANRIRRNYHGARFEVNNPQELGGAQHHRKLFASWEQEAGAQRRKKISSKTGREVDKRQPKDVSSNAKQKVDTQHFEDTSSTSSSEDDDDSDPFDFEPSDLPAPRNNDTQQLEKGTDTAPIVVADSKQPFDPSKSAIWQYLMTLTKTDMPVPDDSAITELLALPRRRNLPRTWQGRLSKFVDFQLNTLTGLILYIGGDEAPSSPCSWMGCSVHAEAHVFWKINFYYGNSIDHRYPFPKCVFLPTHLRVSKSVTERLGHHLCCNAYHRSWKKPPHWVNTVPDDKFKAARDPACVEVMRYTSTEKSAGNESSTNAQGNTLSTATSTSNTGNNAVQPSPSQALLPACPPLQPATMVGDTLTPRSSAQQSTSRLVVKEHGGNMSGVGSSPVNPIVEANKRLGDVREITTGTKTKREAGRQKKSLGGEEQHSSTRQAQVTPVSSAAASLSNLTVQDTSTAPSRSPQQSGPEKSQRTTVFNLANGSTQPIGFKGNESQLLQASKRQTLECTVWAGSVWMKMVGDDGVSITRRVDAGGTWTIGTDSHCLITNFFPAAKETAVVNVKSKSVLESFE